MNAKTAYLAGGCFWGLEELIRQQPGVIETDVGYAGDPNHDQPTYKNHGDHAETVMITYDPTKTSFQHLLDFFFRAHDPTTLNQQGNDIGRSYRSTIFTQTDKETQIAQEMIDIVNASGRWTDPVVTTIEPFTTYYPAEDYHQDYLQNNPGGYTCHFVRGGSYLE